MEEEPQASRSPGPKSGVREAPQRGLASSPGSRDSWPSPYCHLPCGEQDHLGHLDPRDSQEGFGYGVALFLETVAQKAQKCVGTGAAPVWLEGKGSAISAGAPSDLPAQVCLGTDKVASEGLCTSQRPPDGTDNQSCPVVLW